ncbi:hypothetical protein KTC92_03590 [Clostridium sp. CM027]|uniref:hypothetical protein n=1 Tax=Clostridium sp. CM027 TaxID=2849865 RepID=UPI001C6E0675|nr:hypothetical protein [Clostridium sp. CM027]MBW9146764.1 hypothetical protein [Clostridium sp. CM027]UVE41579.1 hypothetical protein KTC92_03590 [Clostridium sp. CM027]
MKNRQKNKPICILITLIIFSFTMLTTNITSNAADISPKNIDLVIVFDDNSIDENIKNIITNSGGKVVEEFPELVINNLNVTQ